MPYDHTRLSDRLVQQTGSYRAWDIAALDGLVDRLWYSRIDHQTPETHRLLPFFEPSLAVRRRFDVNDRTLDCRLVLCSPELDGGVYQPEPGEEQFAVRLAPELLRERLDIAMGSLIGQQSDPPPGLRAACARALSACEERDSARVWHELIVGLARLGSAREQDRIGRAAAIIRSDPGGPRTTQIAEQVGISPRHLRREFRARFEIGPRSLARRLRLTAALVESETLAQPNWAQIAAGLGFSDQPHLVRETRSLLGCTPAAFHRHRRAMAVLFKT